MSFVALLVSLSIGVLVAGMLTNFLRVVILGFSGVAICFYFFGASPEMKNTLDIYASKVTFTNFNNINLDELDVMVANASEETKRKIAETLAKIKQP